MTSLPNGSVLVRTWFGGADADWESLVSAVRTPSEEGFLAYVEIVDDPAFAGLDAEALRTAQPDPAMVSFLADRTTLTDPDHPILAVRTLPDHEDEDESRPFRVVPAELWSVENNLNLSNMDWEEFASAAGPDHVYRGFP
jgi:hypothetical protein